MERFRNYNIIFTSLPFGKSDFEFQLSQSFFDLFNVEQEFTNPRINTKIILDKKSIMLELNIKIHGKITIPCDLTGDFFDQEISNNAELIIKFGDKFDDSDTEIWTIPAEEYQINVAQILYELTILSIPTKHIHPDVLSGKSNSEIIGLLNKYSISEVDDFEDEGNSDNHEVDPRWEILKKLKD